MSRFVVQSIVLAALSSAALPAMARGPILRSAENPAGSSYAQLSDDLARGGKYWSEKSEYYVAPAGKSAVSASPPRHVMISGWHPTEGFEAEVALEAANRAAHGAARQ